MKPIPFNKPYYPYSSLISILRATVSGTISGNGRFTKRVHRFFEERYGFRKCLMTTSCTDALEMSALLAGIGPGDEVIMPSYTFVSTANAFLLRGAKVVFADTQRDLPDIDPAAIAALVTPRTKAIVVVHYSGIACDMDPIMDLAMKHGLVLIEDAAHALDSYYKDRPLGSIGDLGTFSFHETKNIFCGEGGLLAVNNDDYLRRSEILWEKGTDRAAFYRGEVDKYGWVDIGSSYLPSDALAAFLNKQLTILDKIQSKRKTVWHWYHEGLQGPEEQGLLKRPVIPQYATVNGNMYYIVTRSMKERDELIAYLGKKGIRAVFHYPPLHSSPYFRDKHDGRPLPETDRFSETILRLPFYYGLTRSQVRRITSEISKYYQ